MNKKVIALVVAGALAAPLMAQAQQSNVTIYGRLNASLETVRNSNSTTGISYYNRTRINTNISRIGFKGTEDLGNGLKAIWQVETAAAFDNAVGNSAGGTGGILGDRPSFLGLTGNFGTLQLGRLDLPGKDIQGPYNDPWAELSGIGDIGGFWGSAGGAVNTAPGLGSSGTGSLHTRASNSIQYVTPNWGGFTLKGAYSAQNESLAVNNASKIVSASAKYEKGPLTVALSGERQMDLLAGGGTTGLQGNNTTGTGRSNSMIGVGFGYLFPSNTRLGLGAQRVSFDDTATTTRDRNGYLISIAQTFGNSVLRAEFLRNTSYRGSSTLTGSDTGAKMYIVGYGYNLSKRTQLYATYSRINNEANAAYQFGVNGTGAAAGSDPSGLAVGILHYF